MIFKIYGQILSLYLIICMLKYLGETALMFAIYFKMQQHKAKMGGWIDK